MQTMAGEPGLPTEEDAALASRAAWLYHAGGLTQSDIAGRLGVTNAKAHRLIGRATRAGLVRVFVEGPIGSCIAAERALSDRHGLELCRVVPNIDDSPLPIQALGIAAATYLRDVLERRGYRVIGVGHGRTLAAVIHYLPRMPTGDLRLVSLLGGLPRRVPANPYEVIDRLAEKTGADAWLLPVPMFAASAEDCAVLRRQAGVAEALALADRADLLMLGIGEASPEAFLALAGVIDRDEIEHARGMGAEGEVLGYFYDAHGRLVDTPLHGRVTGHPLDPASRTAAPAREIIAVAGGRGKVPAINAVLQSKLLTGLITDELTARQLVAAIP